MKKSELKISRLFHWLYALVMLMPIFALFVTSAYSVFNRNARIRVNNDYVTSSLYIDSNETYYYNNDVLSNGDYGLLYISNIQLTMQGNLSNYSIATINDYKDVVNEFRFYDNNGVPACELYYNDGSRHWLIAFNLSSTFELSFNIENVTNNAYRNVFYKTYDTANAFYYSISQLQNNSFFNWAYDSFLTAPFVYICNLFSMPQNSFIVMLLSYWLAISVIWLIFDLIMYVPLVCHRWLDKGGLE